MQMKAAHKSPGIKVEDLKRFRPLKEFRALLNEVAAQRGLSATWSDPKRKLLLADYLGLFLFSLFNPVITSMRAACAASALPRVGARICSRPVSLGSFSEAQHLVDEALLEGVFEDLFKKLPAAQLPKQVAHLRAPRPSVIDSSVWQVCERLQWAQWRTHTSAVHTCGDAAVRAHVIFDLESHAPAKAQLTSAKTCERRIWKELAEPGRLYVGDRYYGYSYTLLGDMCENGVFFVVRARINAEWVVERERPVDDQARAKGVVWSAWVRLGKKGKGPRVRVVQVAGEEEAILLLTNLEEDVLDAAQVRVLYQNRWQIEYFFRWLKCILGNRHWFCGSRKGMQVQLYLALIAAVLLMLFTGKRPNKRAMEAIQHYLSGWASEEDLIRLLVKYA